jgi:hypothetical protein
MLLTVPADWVVEVVVVVELCAQATPAVARKPAKATALRDLFIIVFIFLFCPVLPPT